MKQTDTKLKRIFFIGFAVLTVFTICAWLFHTGQRSYSHQRYCLFCECVKYGLTPVTLLYWVWFIFERQFALIIDWVNNGTIQKEKIEEAWSQAEWTKALPTFVRYLLFILLQIVIVIAVTLLVAVVCDIFTTKQIAYRAGTGAGFGVACYALFSKRPSKLRTFFGLPQRK